MAIHITRELAQSLGIETKKSKYNAEKRTVDGIRFASKKEAAYYQKLMMLKKNGDLRFFLRQVPFHLPGNIRYVIDFVEFWKDGRVRFVDVKGLKTKEFIRNKKMVEALYPIVIEEA